MLDLLGAFLRDHFLYIFTLTSTLLEVVDLDKLTEDVDVFYPGTRGRKTLNPFNLASKNNFEFGDIRIDLASKYVIVEVDTGHGIYNLIKYWPYFENSADAKPIRLLHVYYHQYEGNYEAYRKLWQFMNKIMSKEVDESLFKATIHPIYDDDLEGMLDEVKQELRYELGTFAGKP